jgi:hypothetical protein
VTIQNVLNGSGSVQLIMGIDSAQCATEVGTVVGGTPAVAGTYTVNLGSVSAGSHTFCMGVKNSNWVQFVLNSVTVTFGGGTPTATPTNTPTATPTVPTATTTPFHPGTPAATNTPTTGPLGEWDCGPAAFPVLNCNMIPNSEPILYPTYWDVSAASTFWGTWGPGGGRPPNDTDGCYVGIVHGFTMVWSNPGTISRARLTCSQNVVAQTSGTVYLNVTGGSWDDVNPWGFTLECSIGSGTPGVVATVAGGTTHQGGYFTGSTASCGHVGAGLVTFNVSVIDYKDASPAYAGESAASLFGTMTITFSPDNPWTPAPTQTPQNTPGPGTPTWTPTSTGTVTPTPAVPIELTGTSTPYASATACPSSTSVAYPTPTGTLTPTTTPSPTATPGANPCGIVPTGTALPHGTVGPDISGLSALYGLSLTRPGCTPLGHLPVFLPSLVQTTSYSYTFTIGTTTTLGPPLQVWWSLPIGPNGEDETAISPCTQLGSGFTWFWDFLYYLQIVLLFIAFCFYQLRRFAWGAFSDMLAT